MWSGDAWVSPNYLMTSKRYFGKSTGVGWHPELDVHLITLCSIVYLIVPTAMSLVWNSYVECLLELGKYSHFKPYIMNLVATTTPIKNVDLEPALAMKNLLNN